MVKKRKKQTVRLALIIAGVVGFVMGVGFVAKNPAEAGSYYSEDKELKGIARAVDGDSLELMGRRLRLHGIDAMEYHQHCFYESLGKAKPETWPCGKQAYQFLQELATQGEMTCYVQEHDKYDRFVSVCFVGGKDVAISLIEQGYAIALEWFSEYYMPIAQRARQQRRGIWQGTFEKPSVWRKKERKRKKLLKKSRESKKQ